MSKAASVNFNTTNLTNRVGIPQKGVNLVMGKSLRGPFNQPDEIINSWASFVIRYGGLMADSDAPLLCKRLLEKGGSIRFCRVGHYTDITDPSTLDAVMASQPLINILEFDSDFVLLNEVDMTINGVPITSIPFAVDNDTTLDNLADEILTSDFVESVTVLDNNLDNNRKILIQPVDGVVLAITAITVTGGATQPVDTLTTADKILDNNGNEIFKIIPKFPGLDFNNFRVTITPGTNGVTGYFNLSISHITDPTIFENYINLNISANTIASEATYLSNMVLGSRFFDIEYQDLSAIVGQILLQPITFRFTGGSNGSTPTDVDYMGDSAAKNGLYAFDAYDDSMQLAIFDNNTDAVNIAASAYAAERKDLIFYLHLDNALVNKSAYIAKRSSLNIDSKYTYILGGGLKITDPITSQVKNISALADVLALVNNSDADFGEWYSFAGNNRGLINGVLGVVNNYGSAANIKDLNNLAATGINMVINRDKSIKLWGNFSAQYKEDQEKQISVVRLIIFLKKSLRPTLENFLEEPNDIPTWKRVYYTVKPFMDSLISRRAIYDYEWQGDQDAPDMSNLKVNNGADVTAGKYKINLVIKPIASIQEINVNIILTPAGLEFEIVSELI